MADTSTSGTSSVAPTTSDTEADLPTVDTSIGGAPSTTGHETTPHTGTSPAHTGTPAPHGDTSATGTSPPTDTAPAAVDTAGSCMDDVVGCWVEIDPHTCPWCGDSGVGYGACCHYIVDLKADGTYLQLFDDYVGGGSWTCAGDQVFDLDYGYASPGSYDPVADVLTWGGSLYERTVCDLSGY